MEQYLCFDIGGTGIKYGVLDARGAILHRGKRTTPRENCSVTIPALLMQVFAELKQSCQISGIGISTAGQVEADGSGIHYAVDTLPGYTGTPLRRLMRESTSLPCVVENDVNAAGLGELWKGAARGCSEFLCVALGTGIGGAIFANGSLVRGSGGGAGEFGHMTLIPGGRLCTCGREGCYEQYASTKALLLDYFERTGERIDGKQFFSRMNGGEAIAAEVFRGFARHVAMGLAMLVYTLDPGLIVLGGGISGQGTLLTGAVYEEMEKLVMPSFFKRVRVVPAALANDAALLGICYLLNRELGGEDSPAERG
jgi:glucokinase